MFPTGGRKGRQARVVRSLLPEPWCDPASTAGAAARLYRHMCLTWGVSKRQGLARGPPWPPAHAARKPRRGRFQGRTVRACVLGRACVAASSLLVRVYSACVTGRRQLVPFVCPTSYSKVANDKHPSRKRCVDGHQTAVAADRPPCAAARHGVALGSGASRPQGRRPCPRPWTYSPGPSCGWRPAPQLALPDAPFS